MVSIEEIKKLRNITGVSVTECKKALEEASGDIDKAKEVLKKLGKDVALKRSNRETKAGIVDSYIHANKRVGVLIELHCETDFVAKSDDFKELAHEICLHVAAFFDEVPIMEQPWIKDSKKTVKDLIDGYIAKFGENIILKQFIRYEV